MGKNFRTWSGKFKFCKYANFYLQSTEKIRLMSEVNGDPFDSSGIRRRSSTTSSTISNLGAKFCNPKIILTVLLVILLYKVISMAFYTGSINKYDYQEWIEKNVISIFHNDNATKNESNIFGGGNAQIPTHNSNEFLIDDDDVVSLKMITRSPINSEVCDQLLPENLNWTIPENSNTPYYDKTVLFTDHWGRLGNNMFELASCMGIAAWHNRTVLILSNNPLLKIYKIRGVKVIDHAVRFNKNLTKFVQFIENIAAGYDNRYKEGLDVKDGNETVAANAVTGYLQSSMYFNHISQAIKCNFRFQDHILDRSQDILRHIAFVYRYMIRYSRGNYHTGHFPPNGHSYEESVINSYVLKGIHAKFDVDFAHDLKLVRLGYLSSSNSNANISNSNAIPPLNALQFKDIIWSPGLPDPFDPVIENSSATAATTPTSTESSDTDNVTYNHEMIYKVSEDGILIDNLNPDIPLTFISVHVRRGDFINNGGRPLVNKKWLFKAMSNMNTTYQNPVFVMCSDDIEWCVNNTASFPFNIAYIKNNKPEIDFAVLTQCNHSIFGYSSYGWWAAYLAGGDVLYLKQNSVKGTWWNSQIHPNEYFLPTWRSI